ncbi:MAG: ABC transporter permease, partial [Saccharofermentans sp.]|nr:ABC transporter permease [Saccharofermentans sp.]
MNTILTVFVVLSACFVAAGLSNVLSVMSGTDYYFEKANLGDYIVVTLGEENIDVVSDRLKGESYVTAVRTELALTVDGDNISLPGKDDYETPDRMIMIQSIADTAIDFFDDDNEVLTYVAPGQAYLSGSFMSENGLNPGDLVDIEIGDKVYTFEIAGHAKDALLGSDFMGNSRFLINSEDWKTI